MQALSGDLPGHPCVVPLPHHPIDGVYQCVGPKRVLDGPPVSGGLWNRSVRFNRAFEGTPRSPRWPNEITTKRNGWDFSKPRRGWTLWTGRDSPIRALHRHRDASSQRTSVHLPTSTVDLKRRLGQTTGGNSDPLHEAAARASRIDLQVVLMKVFHRDTGTYWNMT